MTTTCGSGSKGWNGNSGGESFWGIHRRCLSQGHTRNHAGRAEIWPAMAGSFLVEMRLD